MGSEGERVGGIDVVREGCEVERVGEGSGRERQKERGRERESWTQRERDFLRGWSGELFESTSVTH